MKFSISLLWLMALHCSLFAQDRDKDWPQLDGFSERQSRSEVTYEPPFVFEKRVDAGFSIESFSYVDGVVYFASAGVDNLFGAVDLSAENLLWTFTIPDSRGSVGVHPSVSDSLVFVAGQKGNGLYALNRITGDSVWFQPVGELFGRDIAIRGDLLYVNTQGGLTCFNKSNGVIQWKFDEFSPQYTCAIDEAQIYYFKQDTLYALDRLDGAVNWKIHYSFGGEDLVNIVVHDNKIAIKKSDQLAIFLTDDGSLFNEVTLPEGSGITRTWGLIGVTSDSYLIHGMAAAESDSFNILRIRQSDGEMVWSLNISPGSITPSTLFGNYFSLVNGNDFEIRDVEDGSLIQSFSNTRYNSRPRTKPTDLGILVIDDKGINIFSPFSTSINQRNEDDFSWNILGNPSPSKNIRIEIESNRQKKIRYNVVDLSGKRIQNDQVLSIRSGKQIYSIPFTLHAGNYFLELTDGVWRSTKQVIIFE